MYEGLALTDRCLRSQAMIPFDDEELEYIARLDARADADLLRRELPSLRDSCLRTMEVSTTLLQVRAPPFSPVLTDLPTCSPRLNSY